MKSNKLSNFYLRSGIFTVLSLMGAALNYALYPALAHLLSTSDFGNFTVILALSNQLLAILLSFNILSISLVKNYPEQNAREMAQSIQKVLMRFFLVISVLVLVMSPILKKYLKVDDPVSFFVLALLLLINVPIVIWSGYLQGHKRLINVGIYTFSGALMKFLLAITLTIGFGTIGALWGVLAGTIAGMLLLKSSSSIKLPKIKSVLSRTNDEERESIKSLRGLVLRSIFVVGGLGILQNIDITYAKLFFSPTTAGAYSGVSILSNALYYVGFLLIWIILPEIEPNNKSNNRRILSTAYKLVGAITAGVLVMEILFKGAAIQALLGYGFTGQGNLLIYATLFQISVLSVVLYAFYLLVLGSAKGFWLAISVFVPSIVSPWIFHDSPGQMILSLWLATLLGVALYGIINMLKRTKKSYVSEKTAS